MKLRELIDQLTAIQAREGGELHVDVALHHPEDGSCINPVLEIDADTFASDSTIVLLGGEFTLAPGVTLPAAHDISRELRDERYRQQDVEGWLPAHDDLHTSGELAAASAVYALGTTPSGAPPYLWPYSMDWYRPTDRRRDLVKAGALIIAEIERIDRESARQDVQGGEAL